MGESRIIELLAPAKNLQCGCAAIKAGADALYIGASQFSARANAGNSLQDIEKLVAFAAPFRVKIYAALNTLLYDHELADAHKLAYQLYDAGIDALIIQDMGLLELDLPNIPIHASTQTHNTTTQRIAFLQNAGIERVILARELSIRQIAEIHQNTNVELESFVHGALCVSYSGQCYMSYALGGRSGNRGICAQPCRQLYSLVDSNNNVLIQNKHLLSLKDLNLSASLADLLQAGITSFKIEGRLKDKSYVMNITAYYRKLLDELLATFHYQRSSLGRTNLDFDPNPEKSFNRGFTNYFITGEQNAVACIDSPKSRGEEIGTVKKVSGPVLEIQTPYTLNAGDGLAYFDDTGILKGMRVNKVLNNKIHLHEKVNISPGTTVFRNYDHTFEQTLEKSRTDRKLGVQIDFSETPNGFRISACAENGVTAHVDLHIAKQVAKNAEMAEHTIKQQLAKLGDTMFSLHTFTLDWQRPFFIQKSVLNQARRELCEMLTKKSVIKQRTNRRHLPKISMKNSQQLDYTANVLNDKARTFYERQGVQVNELAAESGLDMHGRRVMTTRYCLKKELGWCPHESKKKITEPFYLVNEHGNRFRLEFDCGICEMHIYYEK